MGAWEQLVAMPGDPGATRVWADALTEQGDPQGEAITLRCLLEDLPPDDPRRAALTRRAERLELQFGREWVHRLWGTPLPGDGRGGLFRALPFELSAQLPTALAAKHLQRRPIAALRASWARAEDLDALAAVPELKQVVDFALYHLWGDLDLAPLFASPHFGDLTALTLTGQKAGWAGPAALGLARRFSLVKRLTLGGFGFDDRAAATVASGFPALTTLEINEGTLTPSAVTALMSGPYTLHTLALRNAGFTGEHLEALLRHPKASALKVLELDGAALGKRAGALLGEARLHTLRLIRLKGLKPDWAAFLAGSGVAHLRELALAGSPLRLEGAKLFAQTKALGALEALDLAGCHLGDGGAMELAAAKGFGALKTLNLRNNSIKKMGMPALAKGPLLAPVETLDLAHNNFGSDGGKALSTSPQLASLRKLILGHNGANTRGMRALLANPAVRRLEEIRAIEGDFGPEMFVAFLKGTAPALIHLDGYAVKKADLMKLAELPEAARLIELTCQCLDFDDVAAAAIVASPYLKGLGALTITPGGPLPAPVRAALREHYGPRLVAPI